VGFSALGAVVMTERDTNALTNLLLLHRQEELELRRQLLFRVKAVGKVDPSDATVGVDLHAQSLDVVGTVSTASEIRQVELDLVPTLVQAHRHGANEGLHTRCGLVVGCPEAPPHVLVIQDLHFESKILFKILDDHHKEG